ncbi:MAG: hypothetical protein U9Q83_01015 [Bacteroidota bacterium]|nr:hypothetical protein [Bacteroidota bacterium]
MQNPFWYQKEGDIAILKENNKEIIISTCGAIRVKLKGEDFFRKNQQAVCQALMLNLTDDDLIKLEFGENNWFDFVYKIGDKEYVEIDGDECFNYDEALELAKETMKDVFFWKQF